MHPKLDGPSYGSLRYSPRPVDAGALGHYSVAGKTTTMAAGAGADSEVLQFRWTDAVNLALISEIRIDAFLSRGTGFAAGFAQFDLTVARTWSADGTGGATLTPSKLRASMPASGVGTIRLGTTAPLGAGTKVFDTNRIGFAGVTISTATNTVFLGGATGPVKLWAPDVGSGEHPLVLAANEGFSIRATVPATGTWDIYCGIRWAELPAY